jgi:predicted transcriptional regulator
VLEATADNKSFEILRSLAKGSVKSEDLKNGELTRKQFYVRTKKLMKTGLIQRVKGQFSLTNFGLVIYHAHLIMENGLNNYWKLKAIDSIQSSGQIAEHERLKLVKTILNDNTIENILTRQTQNYLHH